LTRWNNGSARSTAVVTSPAKGDPRWSLPNAFATIASSVGVDWSPKLVKRTAARPRGAVRMVPNSGLAPSCTAAYT
jgi:hypothetical protein